jgi:hypothetical protein
VDKDGQEVEPIVVESDGSRPVIVVRTDIPNADDPRAKRLSVAANQIAKTDYNPDGELLKEWANEDKNIRAMFADWEWGGITGEKPDNIDYQTLWQGMPEFEQNNEAKIQLIVSFANEMDRKEFLERIGVSSYTEKTKSIWYPERKRGEMDQLGTKEGLVYSNES